MQPTFVFSLLDCSSFEQGYNACMMGLTCTNGTHFTPSAFKLGYWWAQHGLTFPVLPHGCRIALNR